MKKMSEKKIKKQLLKLKNDHKLIVDYAENYALIDTGKHEDFNNYDFTLKDNEGNQLTLRKTLHGDQNVDMIFILKTNKGRYVNEKYRYKESKVPAEVYCMTSGKEWKFSFKGNVINTQSPNRDKSFLEFNAVFSSDEPIVDMFDQINNDSSVSKLKTSYPDQKTLSFLGIADQVSYEQQGTIKAEVKFDSETMKLNSKGLRKHNFGTLEFQNLLKFLRVA